VLADIHEIMATTALSVFEQLQREEHARAEQRDHAEEVADFLTLFQSAYSSDVDLGKIFSHEIKQVQDYREACDRLSEMKERAAFFLRVNKVDEHPYQADMDYLQQKIVEMETDRLLYLDVLLEKFEVWSTKALAQHMLISHNHKRHSESDATCYSIIMSLPSAAYMYGRLVRKKGGSPPPKEQFSQVWNSIYNHESQDHQCALLIPPNIHNFEEYARIAHMMALLPTDEAREACNRSIFSGKTTQKVCSTKFHLRPHELVVLWVRAQRQTSALRQLTNMFVVSKTAEGTFQATYAGNHKLSYQRAAMESPLIDQITSYAVMNQIILTDPHIKAAWKERVDREPPSHKLLDGQYRIEMKLACQTEKLNEKASRLLLRACRTYLLRLLCRRNFRAVQLVLYKKKEQLKNALECCGKPKLDKIAKRVNIEAIGVVGSERYIVRIARRLENGLYDSIQAALGDDFYKLIHDLLQSLLQCVKESSDSKEVDPIIYEQCIDDWNEMYEAFVREYTHSGIVAAARRFLNDNVAWNVEPSALVGTLTARTAPWADECAYKSTKACDCRDSVVDSKFRVCACCDKIAHEQCCLRHHWMSYKSLSFIKSCPSLREIWKIKALPATRVPDYRGDRATEVIWETTVRLFERKKYADGSVEHYGMHYQDLDVCQEYLDKIINGDCYLYDLDERFQYAVAFKEKGVLVTQVKEGGLADQLGIRVGDVIRSVKHTNVDESFEGKPNGTEKGFLSVTREERKRTLSIIAAKTQMVLQRPDAVAWGGVVEWVKELVDMYKYVRDSLKTQKDPLVFWYCDGCQQEKVDMPDPTLSPLRIVQEARWCKIVIQSLRLESSAAKLFNKDLLENETSRKPSLRRLECMMEYIIQKFSSSDASRYYDPVLARAFCMGAQRLEWAPESVESSPVELLCLGIDELTRFVNNNEIPSTISNLSNEEKTSLLSQFWRIVCSWCVGAVGSGISIHTRGPPPFLLSPDFPREVVYCSKCLINAKTDTFSSFVCLPCSCIPNGADTRIRIDHVLAEYEEHTAWIGKSILVLPGDPVIEIIRNTFASIDMQVQDCGRFVELIVLAFLPSESVEESETLFKGSFFLLPIISQKQLEFLLRIKCKPRTISAAGNVLNPSSLSQLTKDELLGLPGIIRWSHVEVKRRVGETMLIHDAISREVASLASCSCNGALRPVDDEDPALQRAEPFLPCKYTSHGAAFSCKSSAKGCFGRDFILEDVIHARVPPVLNLLDWTSEEPPFLFTANESNAADLLLGHDLLGPLYCPRKSSVKTRQATVPMNPQKQYEILYSDIIGVPEESIHRDIDPRRRCGDYDVPKFVTLERSFCIEEQSAPWGMELLAWQDDFDWVRIGGISHGSIAQQVGLATDDIVLSINGKSPKCFSQKDISALSSALRCPSLADATGSDSNVQCIIMQIQKPVASNAGESSVQMNDEISEVFPSRLDNKRNMRVGLLSPIRPSSKSTAQAQLPPQPELVFPVSIFCDRMTVLYSDLYQVLGGTSSPTYMEHDIVHPWDPSSTLRQVGYGQAHYITLQKWNFQSGVGWGFELVRWGNDQTLYVGRVKTNSEAYSAGIRPNDIIDAVNLTDVSNFSNYGELARAVLGLPSTSAVVAASSAMDTMAYLIGTPIGQMQLRNGEPVTFTVRTCVSLSPEASYVSERPGHCYYTDFLPPSNISHNGLPATAPANLQGENTSLLAKTAIAGVDAIHGLAGKEDLSTLILRFPERSDAWELVQAAILLRERSTLSISTLFLGANDVFSCVDDECCLTKAEVCQAQFGND
jgi:hypothetical protein